MAAVTSCENALLRFFAVLVAVAEDAAFVTPPYSTVTRGQTPYTGRLRRKG